MPVAYVKVSIPSKDLTLDASSIHFTYEGPPAGPVSTAQASALMAKAASFYTTVPSGYTNPLGSLMATSLDFSHGADCSTYDITTHLDGSDHGPPVASAVVGIGSGPTLASNHIPEGVAISLSYRADYGTDTEFVRDPVTHKVIGRPRARDRGRIFVGPFNQAVVTNDSTTQRVKVDPVVAAALLAYFHAIRVCTIGSDDWLIKQWSIKKAAVQDIVLTWVDDRPDYQRRRADQSGVRYTLSWP